MGLEGNCEPAATRAPRLVGQSSAEALDDLPGYRQAEACALSIGFRRKKRLKYPVRQLLGDSGAFVVDVDVNRAVLYTSAHCDGRTRWTGLARIVQQIDEDLG